MTMKSKWDCSYVAISSLIISTLLVFPYVLLGSSTTALIVSFFVNSIAIFLFWTYVRWVASTAERAGRSYVGFMLVAIFFGGIAWIIVLMFKKPEPQGTIEL
jgi:VIT1/CCC1 family predicted Fe2+/Mn2+ transporter